MACDVSPVAMFLADMAGVDISVQIGNCICKNRKEYLSKLQNIFVKIAKCIC